jgi:DNA-binding beta-propeller fold protein YncE
LWGGTYGKLAAVRGMISDLALDERRGVVYAANMTANRVELIRTDTAEISGSMAVGEAPSTLALSPDQRFLVIGHFGGGVTIQDLDAQQRRVLTMPAEVATPTLRDWVTGTDRSRTTTRAVPPAGIGFGSARYQTGSPAFNTSAGGSSQ